MGLPARSSRSGTFGNLKEFNPEKDRILPYLERASLFLRANKVEDDDKVAVFLSVIGASTYEVLRNLTAPER